MKKSIKKTVLASAILIVLGVAVLYGRYGRVSVCHHCAAVKYDTEWEVPFMSGWRYFHQERVEETPLSLVLSKAPALASRPHQWISIHGSGNGVKCALGSGGPVFAVARDPHMAQVVEASRRYADPQFQQQLVHAMLCPESAQSVGMAGYEMPEGGITSREAFLAWRQESQENLAQAFEAAGKTAWDEPVPAVLEAAPPSSPACALASDLLASLDPKQKPKAQLAWDSPDRTHWHFLPMAFRKGLPLAEMTEAQKEQTFALLATVLSADALAQAKLTLDREAKLAALEKSPIRDPGRYFLTLFGDPDGKAPWGFSFEGHHLSLNFSFDQAQLASVTPMFFGANPAFTQGQEPNLHRAEEEHLLAFVATLSPEQLKEAALPAKAARDAGAGGGAQVRLPKVPVGLSAAKMTVEQRAAFHALIRMQVEKTPGALAKALMEQVEKEDLAGQCFAFSGEAKIGATHTCLIQTGAVCVFSEAVAGHGPPKANHLHTMWRRVGKDF